MPTRATDPGLSTAVRRVSEHARSLVSLEVELAKLELREKAIGVGLGAALLGAAALVGMFVLAMLFHGIAWAFATFLPTWAGFLVTAGIALLLAGILAAAGAAALRRGTPPVPKQAIEEARRTTEALRGNGR